jgi:hypothetical protein
MDNISIYLQKFSKIGLGERELKENIILIIKNKLGFELKREDIKIKDGVITINTTPITKNEIFINKEAILKEIQSKLGAEKTENIK